MTIEAKYQCCECGAVYEQKAAVFDCCLPNGRVVYQCPTCAAIHSDESKAVACCRAKG